MATVNVDQGDLFAVGQTPLVITGVTQPYTTFVKDMAPFVTNCPSPVMVDALRNASIEFFRRSLAYRVWLTPFNMTATVSEYVLSGFPFETELAHIVRFVCDSLVLTPVTNEEVIGYDPAYPTTTSTRPRYYTMHKKPRIKVSPVPSETLALAFIAYVAVQPTLDSVGVEQAYMDEYRDYLIAGALSRLLMIPNRHWTDLQLGAMKQARFNAGIEYARIQANKGHTRRDLRVQPRAWV